MKSNNVFELWNEMIHEYSTNLQHGTAHVYRSAFRSFMQFNNNTELLPFRKLTPGLLRNYEHSLLEAGRSWNTIGTYMKCLRAVYNRAVNRRLAPFTPHLFKHVCTSPKEAKKRALEAKTMNSLLNATDRLPNEAEICPAVRKAQLLFALMFLLRGIPFVDMAYLRKSDLRGDELTYHRRKTGRSLTVRLTPEAQGIISTLQSMETPRGGYLLPLVSLPQGSLAAYREYQSALRRFNRLLKRLSPIHPQLTGLSSYCARHTWATTAYHLQMQTGLISEAMGHASISVTESYLKAFRNEAIHKANRLVIDYILSAHNLIA